MRVGATPRLLALLLLLLPCGCAMLMRGTHESLLVSSEPEGARVELSDGQQGQTPALFRVYRRSELDVSVSLDGHATRLTRVEHRESRGGGMLALATFLVTLPVVPFNFLIFAADNWSGAVFELTPSPIDVELRPLDGRPWARLPLPSRSLPEARSSCEEPYPLERDCSYTSRARRKVRVRGLYVYVSGSEDGRALRVEPAVVSYDVTRPLFSSERHVVVRRRAAGATESCERVHRHLSLAGARLEELVVLTREGHPDACYLVYDRDVYALLPST